MIELLAILIRRRRFLILTGIAAAGFTAGLSFLLPPWFRADASLLPPQRDASLPALSEITELYDLPYTGYIMEGRMGSLLYIDILKSRTVAEEVIRKFGLQEIYGEGSLDDAVKTFHRRTFIKLQPDGIVSVSHEEKDPQLAAEITNGMIDALDRFNLRLNAARGEATRKFVEEQLRQRRILLSEAEDELRRFREDHQAVELDAQMVKVIELVGDLRAREVALSLERSIIERTETAGSLKLRRIDAELEEIRAQLGSLQGGVGTESSNLVAMVPEGSSQAGESASDAASTLGPPGDPASEDAAEPLPPLVAIPGLMMEAARLERDVEIHGKVLILLSQQLERARIEETKDTPTLNIIDPARVPDRRVRPRRGMMVIFGTLAMMAWAGVLLIVWDRYVGGGLRPAEAALLGGAYKAFQTDIWRLFSRKRAEREGPGGEPS